MAARKADRLAQMAQAPEDAAPDLHGADAAPDMDGTPPALPQPCPVTPLGMMTGTKLVFLDGLNKVEVAPCDCRKGDMLAWFGADYLHRHFPVDGGKERWDQRGAQEALIQDCRARGIFNPLGKVLGRGAHRVPAEEDALILHTGREVWVARPRKGVERNPPGVVKLGNKDIYFPAADALPRPAVTGAERAEAEQLLILLRRWYWVDPVAPLLLLGFIGQAMICGALSWRAHIWMPGPTASGKSALQRVIRAVLDEWCLQTADASEAAVRQRLDTDALAVSIDEAEKHDNPERLQGVLNLIKKSSSGDIVLRGSQDHKAREFVAKSCFLLSSVLHASLRGEDRNRIALLELHKIPENAEEPDLELARWRSAGRRMHRRMIEQWRRFDRTLALYRRAIGEQRMEGRWQDTYGTLLACADLLLYDNAPDDMTPDDEPGMERVRNAVLQVLPMLHKSKGEARNDTERAIAYLLSKSLPGAHGKAPEPVGAWLARAMDVVAGEFPSDPEQPNDSARERLKAHGMRVVQLVDKPDPKQPGRMKRSVADAAAGERAWEDGYLALAYPSHSGMREFWKGTEWSDDGYKQSLGKAGLDGRPVLSGVKVRFSRAGTDNALLVPLAVFRGEEG